MAELKRYRHKVTGLIQELDPITARGMGDRIEEVEADAKPKVPLNQLVDTSAKRATRKEQKNG